jgi:hypothetical protein
MINGDKFNPSNFVGTQAIIFESNINEKNTKQNNEISLRIHSRIIKQIVLNLPYELQKNFTHMVENSSNINEDELIQQLSSFFTKQSSNSQSQNVDLQPTPYDLDGQNEYL